jgi:CubicO group peptidase (beta-lactamase class C family)
MSVDPRVDKIFEQWKRTDSPGMAIAVTRKGKLVHRNAYGMADLDPGHVTPNTPETVFHCASLAKQFTAMSLLLLEGQGKITLDDDVRDYIDELDRQHIPKITIRQLLHHTSGIRDILIQLTLAGWRWGDDDITRGHILDLVSRMKTLNFTPPGSKFAYSNTNYFLAGEIVSRVSKMPLSQFARDKIFGPLGMTSTRFVDTFREPVANRASGYRRHKDPGQGFEKRIPNYDFTGPTNLYTTVDDLMKWDANFGKPDPAVGGADAIAKLQRATPASDDYGLGLYVLDTDGVPQKIYHDGRTIGYRSHLFRDYVDEVSIALLCNVEFSYVKATHDLVFAISEVVQGRQPTSITIDEPDVQLPPSTKARDEYRGTYRSGELNAEFEVEKVGASLVIKRPTYPDCTLADGPHPDTFLARRFTDVLREVKFTFVRFNGKVTQLQLDWSGGLPRLTDFRFDRKP